jgi:integrative and conjugative element protein (TIGR02256 family)
MSADLIFKSRDARFGLKIVSRDWRVIQQHCRQAKRLETGGILIGHYNLEHDIAIVGKVTGPPADSRQLFARFTRGVKGLDVLLDWAWQHNRYYLGEWHWHPGALPNPSALDLQQMRSSASENSFGCTHPVLLIIGGNDGIGWSSRAFVFPKSEDKIELHANFGLVEIISEPDVQKMNRPMGGS